MNLQRLRPPNPHDYLPTVQALEVRSESIDGEGRLDAAHRGTDQDGGLSPHVSWAEGPEGTESYAVSMFDIDAPTPGGIYHWMVVNIPEDVRELSVGSRGVGTTMLNDLGSTEYAGAAPPQGDWEHRYLVTVWAMGSRAVDLAPETPASLTAFHLTMGSLARGSVIPVV